MHPRSRAVLLSCLLTLGLGAEPTSARPRGHASRISPVAPISPISQVAHASPVLQSVPRVDGEDSSLQPDEPEEAVVESVVVADEPLEEFQIQLLELAFRAASAMPLMPHVKNRSRAQQDVVSALFELRQPERALVCIEQIANWRRGAGHADYAWYCAQLGALDEVQPALDLAYRYAQLGADEDSQEWRKDQVLGRIAETHLALGDADRAASFATGLVQSEAARVEVARARLLGPAEVEAQLAAVPEVARTGTFDQLRGALDICAGLFDGCYPDESLRAAAERTLKGGWDKLPLGLRLEYVLRLGDSALAHHDLPAALALADEGQAMLEGFRWDAEQQVQLQARLAALRHQAGDRLRARLQADAALACYELERENIVDIFRADALLPLAETYQVMGDTVAAQRIYRLALDEGMANANARPRAEDLCATCCSMAQLGVEPDEQLWKRMRSLVAGLGDPW